MSPLAPRHFLENPSLVQPAAPWCKILDNLELGILLLTQPWLVGPGLRRSAIERRLEQFAGDMPVGAIYPQRINRAVADLEKRGALQVRGTGRGRRFVLAPQGFAALLLNLTVLEKDPTIDGSEFEFKRELVAAWNLLLGQLVTSSVPTRFGKEMADFFTEVDGLTIWGNPVVTPELMRITFDVRQLLQLQRERVEQLRNAEASRLAHAEVQAALLREADLSQIDLASQGDQADALRNSPELLEVLRQLTSGGVQRLAIKARLERYDAYLGYLSQLAEMYGSNFEAVDLHLLRGRTAGTGE